MDTIKIEGLDDDPGLRMFEVNGCEFPVDVLDAMHRFAAINARTAEDWQKVRALLQELGGPSVSTAAAMAFFKKVTELGVELKKNLLSDTETTPASPTGSPE